MSRRPQGKGKLALGILAVSILLAGGVAVTLAASKSDSPSTIRTIGRVNRAKIALAEREYAKAEELLRDELSVRSHDLEAKALLGRVLLARGRLKEARELFAQVLKKDSENYEAARGLAEVSEGMEQMELAVAYWQRATQLKKNDPETWKGLGLAQHKKGDSMGALASIQKSLELDPDQADLSLLVTEIAMGQRPGMDPAAGWPGATPRNPLKPEPLQPGMGNPRPSPPDPSKHLPKPPWSQNSK